MRPHPLLAGWALDRGLAGGELTGSGRRAIVVGSGLGADAELIAGLGFETVGFDVAETAVRIARQRFPDSRVHYTEADLLDLPAQWLRAFDLVVDVFTVQALPDPPRDRAIVNVGRLVAPGGTLVVIAAVHDGTTRTGRGRPGRSPAPRSRPSPRTASPWNTSSAQPTRRRRRAPPTGGPSSPGPGRRDRNSRRLPCRSLRGRFALGEPAGVRPVRAPCSDA